MRFTMEQAVEILSRTPAAIDAMLRGLSAGWIRPNEGPDTWSPFDIVGHLIHGEEADWMPRARIIMSQGESRVFEPFDRTAQFARSKGRSLAELLDTFAALRRENLERLSAMELTDSDLARRGRHPELGVVTMGELLSTWVVHDLGHLAQISRVMAAQYREAVGPWCGDHLPILVRRGGNT